MKIILKKNIEKLGFQYEEINVKPGFAINYLIPKGDAILATPSVIKHYKEILRQKYKKEKYIINKATKKVKQLQNISLKIHVKSGLKVFGYLTNQDLAKELAKKGIQIENKFLFIPKKKTRGKYIAKIKLHRNIETLFKFEIISDSFNNTKTKN